jgi:AraC-like DNA-binding protein
VFFYPEADQLKSFIVCYWVIETSGIPFNTKMMPDGYSDIMINLGAAYSITRNDGSTVEIKHSAVFGQRTAYLLLQQPGNVNMIGIRLKPGSEFAFFGNQVSALVNNHIALQDLVSMDLTATEKQLIQTTDPAKKIQRVEEMLIAMLDSKTRKQKQDHIDPVLSKMLASFTPDDSLEKLLAKLNLSYKQAERLFKKHIGLTPKQYFRVVRFYKAFSQMREKKAADWITILHANNYFDQAHFIKDFRFFTGQSPTRQKGLKDTLNDFFQF